MLQIKYNFHSSDLIQSLLYNLSHQPFSKLPINGTILSNSTNIPTKLLTELKSDNVDQRRSALIQLIQKFKGFEVEKLVYEMVLKEPDPELKYLARKAYSRLQANSKKKSNNKTSDVKALVDKLLNQSEEKRKEVYQRVLSSDNDLLKMELLNRIFRDIKAHEEKDSITKLIKSNLSNCKTPDLIPVLIQALGIFGTEKEITIIQKYLHHSDARVVANAVESLDFIGVDYSASMVNHLLSHEDNRVRGNAIKLIFQSNPEKGIQEITKLSKSNKAWMRATALYCIKSLDFENKPELLLEMLENEWDNEIKDKIFDLSSQIADLKFAKILIKNSLKNESTEFDKLLQTICSRLAVDFDLLKNEMIKELSNKAQANKIKHIEDQAKKQQNTAKSKVIHEKQKIKKKTPIWQIAALSSSVVVLFSCITLFKLKVIDQKSYSLNPFSQKKAKNSDSIKLLMQAERFINQKQINQAINDLNNYIKSDKYSKKALFLLSECYILQNKNKKAFDLLIKLAKKNTRDAKIYHRIGVLSMYRFKQMKIAKKHLDIALKLKPNHIKTLVAIGQMYLIQNKDNEAQKYYDIIKELIGQNLKNNDFQQGLKRSML
ncbi:MAG: hypothetical protein COB02_05780 [Candidatus Cloacimonadota bacterium]|nr:MAG: hypothetical protein COB02_05780 [Candidatus Cloacimonadota bacterium]